MDAVVSGAANEDVSAVLALVPEAHSVEAREDKSAPLLAAAADPRLGVEAVRPRSEVRAPSAERELPVALLAAANAHPITRLGSLVSQWASGPAQPWARELWTLTADLALLEAIERARGHRAGAPHEALTLYAKAFSLGVTDGPQQERFERALRWTLAKAPGDPAMLQPLAALSRAALRHPEIAARLASALSRTQLAPTLESFELYGSLVAARLGGLALWIRAVRTVEALRAPLPRASLAPLNQSLTLWLGSARDELVGALRALDVQSFQQFFRAAAAMLSVEPMVTLIDALWPLANELQRARLAASVVQLLERDNSIGSPLPDDLQSMLEQLVDAGIDDSEIRRRFRVAFRGELDDEMLEELAEAIEIAKTQRRGQRAELEKRFEATLARLGERAAAYNEQVLTIALEKQRDRAEVARWVRATLAQQPTTERVLRVAHDVYGQHRALGLEQLDALLARADADPSIWQRLGQWLYENPCGCPFSTAAAQAYFDATMGKPDATGAHGRLSFSLERLFPLQYRQAMRALKARKAAATKKKPAAKKKTATKKPAAKKPAAKKPAAKKPAAKKPAAKKPAAKKPGGDLEPR
jgi:hypothetical protein